MTLEQLVKLEQLRKDLKPDTDKLDLLYAYAEIMGITNDEVDAMDLPAANELMKRCYKDLQELPKQLDIKELRLKEIEGVLYSFDITFNEWKLKEFVDFDYLLKNEKENISKIIAIYFRPVLKQPTWIDKLLARFKPYNPYQLQPYNSKDLQARAEILGRNLTADEGYTLLLFFCEFMTTYLRVLENFLNEEMKKKTEKMKADYLVAGSE
jgi:hypothetical protein